MTEPRPEPRARRLALSLAVGAWFGALGVLVVRADWCERVFVQVEMKSLPAPTEAFLAIARFARTPAGFAVLTLTAAAAVFAIQRGHLDAWLKPLFWLTALGGAALLGLFWLGLELPIRKLHEAMGR